MTVEQLIEALRQFRPEAPIVFIVRVDTDDNTYDQYGAEVTYDRGEVRIVLDETPIMHTPEPFENDEDY